MKILLIRFVYDNGLAVFSLIINSNLFICLGTQGFRDFAFSQGRKLCCQRDCLNNHFPRDSEAVTNFVEHCLLEINEMNQTEKSAYFRQKVSGTIKAIHTKSKYAEHEWSVGAFPNAVVNGVCRYLFGYLSYCYNI